MFAYGYRPRRRRLRARRPDHRPGQHLRRRGQAAAARPGRHRLRGRPDRDRDPGRRLGRPGVRRRRPDQPGRARHGRGQRARHRLDEDLADAVRAELDVQVASHQAHRAGRRPPWRRRSRRSSGRRPRAGPAGRRRLRRRAPGAAHRDADERAGAGPQRRRGLRRAVRAGLARRLRGRLQPRAADRRVRLPLQRAVGADVPQDRCRSSTTPSRRWPTVGGDVQTLAEAEDLPGHGDAVRLRLERAGDRADWRSTACRCARSWSGSSRTAPRSSTSPVRLNTNENPYGPSRARAGQHRRGGGGRGRRASTAIPTGRRWRCGADLAALPRARPDGRPGLGRQRVQRGHGAGPAGVRRAGAHLPVVRADVLDVSRVRARHLHPLGGGSSRRTTFEIDVDDAVATIERRAARRRLPRLAEQPDRHRAAARHPARRSARGRARHRRRRRGVRGVPARGDAVGAVPARPTPAARRSPGRCRRRSRSPAAGWATSPRAATFVDALRVVRLPYHLSAVTQAVARAALAQRRRAARQGRRPAGRARPTGRLAARASG